MTGGRTSKFSSFCELNSWGKEFIVNSGSELVESESLRISMSACIVKVGGAPTG